jgi:UDP-N-acetylglucosamine diphosphorylase/glucosamine-1-phosphate N-acetyltransferase
MVVLDSTGGPITVEDGVTIFPHSRIEGPCHVGQDTQIVGGKIREGCSIGPVCRVGGEVEEAIIHGYSNKYHDGFLGHAYVGEWVNLGALTTNSDLKNDYSTVEVKLNGQPIDTNDTKVGSFIGDHTKTSIGTLFNTGSIVGMMTNILGGSEILPKTIPSFCLFANGKAFKGFGLRKLLQTAETAMGRRKVAFTEADRSMLTHAYELTKDERQEAVKKSRRQILSN